MQGFVKVSGVVIDPSSPVPPEALFVVTPLSANAMTMDYAAISDEEGKWEIDVAPNAEYSILARTTTEEPSRAGTVQVSVGPTDMEGLEIVIDGYLEP